MMRSLKPVQVPAVTLLTVLWALLPTRAAADTPVAGADQSTPSRAEYFTWINNTNEGPTEAQTLVNLEFFAWLKAEFGMQLDVYAFDAGAIDGAGHYGNMNWPKFRQQFPRGFAPISEKAAQMNLRLGLWGGPDGFGQGPEQEKERRDMLVSLCRDFRFGLFKFDLVSGPLRPEKRMAFAQTMAECRQHMPDLIVLNHRLDLGPEGIKHATTSLWEGAETYIDVHMHNRQTAPHHRAEPLARDHTPQLNRLMEDHGVCLSSALDFWDDELVLQAFARSLIVAPQIYGNPWLLRDEEFPQLARLFNLHRQFRDLLVNGLLLAEDRYGPAAIARGDAETRIIVLRNLSWQPVQRVLELGAAIGLKSKASTVSVLQVHPTERNLGRFAINTKVDVTVEPFRTAMFVISSRAQQEPSLRGVDYKVVQHVSGKPTRLRLLAPPGAQATISLDPGSASYSKAVVDGKAAPTGLLQGKPVRLQFPGRALKGPSHRQLGSFVQEAMLPAEAEAVYEATMFAADNNALEVRSLQRSGPTRIPQVQAARDAFFKQPLFVARGLWDRNLFDDDVKTGFYISRRWGDQSPRGAFRLDLGQVMQIDRLVFDVGNEDNLQPHKSTEAVPVHISADLKTWQKVQVLAGAQMVLQLPPGQGVRYVRMQRAPERVNEIRGFRNDKPVDRTLWRASNLFPLFKPPGMSAAPSQATQPRAWRLKTRLKEAAPNSYLALAVNGHHGADGVVAAIGVKGRLLGPPDRAPSYKANTWESPVRGSEANHTFYFPVTPDLVGQDLDVVLLALDPAAVDIRPELWLTSYPGPHAHMELELVP